MEENLSHRVDDYSSQVPTREDIEKRKGDMEQRQDLTEEARKSILDTYDKTLQLLEEAKRWNTHREDLARSIREASPTLEAIDREIAGIPASTTLEVQPEWQDFQLAQFRAQAQALVEEASAELGDREKERAELLLTDTLGIGDTRAEIGRLMELLAAGLPEHASPEIAEAERTLWLTQLSAALAKESALEVEQTSVPVRMQVLDKQIERTQRIIQHRKERLSLWDAAIEDRKIVSAEEATRSEAVIRPISREDVERQRNSIGISTTIDENARAQALLFLDQAVQHLENLEGWVRKAWDFERLRVEAPEDLRRIEQELAAPPRSATPAVPPESMVDQLELMMMQDQSYLVRSEADLSDLMSERDRRVRRRIEVPARIGEVKSELDNVNSMLAVPVDPTQHPDLSQARRMSLLARKRALEQESLVLGSEVQTYDLRRDILSKKIDLGVRQVSFWKRRMEAWAGVIQERRAQEAARDLREALEELKRQADAPVVIRKVAQEAVEIAREYTGIDGVPRRRERTDSEHAKIRAKLARTTREYDLMRDRLEAGGLTHGLGVLLREQSQELPRLREHHRNIRAMQIELSRVEFRMVDLEEQALSLRNIETEVTNLWQKVRRGETEMSEETFTRVAMDLLRAKRRYLDRLRNEYEDYRDVLLRLLNDERQLVNVVTEYRTFINEHVFWIRSANPFWLRDIVHSWKGLLWILSPYNWWGLILTILRDLQYGFLFYIPSVALFIFLFRRREDIQKALQKMGSRAASRMEPDYLLDSFKALGFTMLLAGLIPCGALFVAWRIFMRVDVPEFTRAFGLALGKTAILVFFLNMVRQTCEKKGLGESHFEWDKEVMSSILRRLDQFTNIMALLVFAILLLEEQESVDRLNGLGRLLFIAAMISLALYEKRVLDPLQKTPGKLQGLKHPAIILTIPIWLPVVLAVTAVSGYYYTAFQIFSRVLFSLWVIFGLILADGIAHRWLRITRRRLAIREARRKYELEKKKREQESEEVTEKHEIEFRQEEIDIPNIDAKSRKLLRSLIVFALVLGLWVIWSDVLPALDLLDQVRIVPRGTAILLQSPEVTAGGAEAASGQTWTRDWVTLRDVLAAVVVLFITVMISRNIPSLIEIILLQWFAVEAGIRYAVVTVSKYVIMLMGTVAAFNAIGVDWGSLQWLVAAMGVGLGFGLQEIFGNFISGLIILFERPIRIGDTVSVAEQVGTVTRIRIRATTITDWDRKEIIIPNKEFITGKLINWTLSDTILRIILKVGIAYGSDTELAHRKLLECARKNPNVLPTPEPRAIFEGFGDSTLDFSLRVYIPSIDVLAKVRDELNTAIDNAFREAEIEIAFPQRDLHIRSVEPLFRVEGLTGSDGKEPKA